MELEEQNATNDLEIRKKIQDISSIYEIRKLQVRSRGDEKK